MLDPRFKKNQVYLLIVPSLKLLDPVYFQHIMNPSICILKFGLDEENKLTMLCDPNGFFVEGNYINEKKHNIMFQNTLDNVRKKDFYVTDYPQGEMHIMKINLPPEVNIEAFVNQEFSEIYSREIIEELFTKTSAEFKILTKDPAYLQKFIKRLGIDFKMSKEELQDIANHYEKNQPKQLNYFNKKENEYIK